MRESLPPRFESSFQLAVYYLRTRLGLVFLLAVLFAGLMATQFVNPLIVRHFIDVAVARGSTRTLLMTAGLFLAVALARQVFGVAEAYVAEYLGQAATNRMRVDLARHCLRLDMGFHKKHMPGEMIERIDGDTALLANTLSRFIVSILGNLVLLLGVLAIFFRVDWRVAIPMSAISIGGILTLGYLQKHATKPFETVRQAHADQFGYLEERLAGTDDIRANGAAEYTLRGLYPLMRTLFRNSLRAQRIGNSLWLLPFLFFVLGHVVTLGFAAYLFLQHRITIGTVYMLHSYALMLRGPINEIAGQMQGLQQASASLKRARELLSTSSALVDPSPEQPAATVASAAVTVSFDHVSFAYDRDVVLRDISFTLEPGAKLGLLGRTGSGKTTLIRLLCRLYDPTEGAVRLDGVDLRDVAQAAVRERVAIATQNVQFFNATVRDNLTLFDQTIPDAAVLAALEQLELMPWLEALPDGLDTVMKPESLGLSAGESQLVALTRIFLADPAVVVLDEPTARLDPATERRLERAFDRLLEGRTGIIIAHRLSTVERVDRILILSEGTIVEQGVRAALAADPTSAYFRLLQTGLAEVMA